MVKFFMIDLGTDINKEWRLNNNGDIELISKMNNLIQALTNRLKTPHGHFNWCYGDIYGSDLQDILGEYNTDKIGEYACIIVEYAVIEDSRVYEVKNIDYTREDNKLIINLIITLINNTDVELNLVINKDHTVKITNGEAL